jgi:hypothetical protein
MAFNATFNNIFQLYRGGGGNQSTQRKPSTCCKSLTNFELTTSMVIGTDYIGSYETTTIRSRPQPPYLRWKCGSTDMVHSM